MASTGKHAFWAGDSFYVNHDGTLHSSQGDIGGWQIKADRLEKNNVGLSPVYTTNTPNAFWAGNVFHVTHSGYLYAKNGEIGNWRFGNNGLYGGGSASTYNGNNSGVYVGADGIRLGSTFHVDPSGRLYARSGDIGSCTITNGGLSGNGWYIDGSGAAKFTDVEINGAKVTNMMRASGSGGISGQRTISSPST